MNIAIDVSPLKTDHYLQHRVRGTGFYINNLNRSLERYYPEDSYTFFSRGENLPKKVDLVHYPYFEPFFLTIPLLNKCKTVVTVHDLTPLVFPSQFPRGIKGQIKWQIQKLALRRANAVITDSESSKRDIIKHVHISSRKIHVVYLAAGEEFKRIEISSKEVQADITKLRKKYNLPEKFILYVGDVTWNKNLPRLIKAAGKKGLQLVMAGSAILNKDFDFNNPWNKDLIQIQSLAKENPGVICTGFVDQEELVVLYNLATVFVMPSIYEGFGLPVLEAMKSGCPVVTAKSGSLPEVAGNAAYYVNPLDEENIAEGLNEVFKNAELRKNLSDKGFIQAKKFSWKKTAEETMRVYRSL